MPVAIFFFRRLQTRRISIRRKQTYFEYVVDIPYQPSGHTVSVIFVRLDIRNHTPCAYFDVADISNDNYRLTIITVIAINMDVPDREQVMAIVNLNPPVREQFMAGVNSTGPDGRLLPAGAAAAARMTAAYAAAQEAAREQDEDTFSTASTDIEDAKGEEKIAQKKGGGEQKSLIRRLFGGIGDKVAAALKREQEKKDQ